ncbi:hypothetical protein HMPREF1548_02831 [Clostridium sp. KLE 1755]|nr:hypothetical protein HMPREF1548_02831 [Clostridium sp. KLE 1755]
MIFSPFICYVCFVLIYLKDFRLLLSITPFCIGEKKKSDFFFVFSVMRFFPDIALDGCYAGGSVFRQKQAGILTYTSLVWGETMGKGESYE